MLTQGQMAKLKSKKINIIPTPGYVLIQAAEDQKKTASGIYLPDSVTPEKPQKGKVIAVGSDEILENGTKRVSPAKVGDTVIYKKWGGNDVKLDDMEYLFVKFDDVLALIES